jgi:hypothetical protein
MLLKLGCLRSWEGALVVAKRLRAFHRAGVKALQKLYFYAWSVVLTERQNKTHWLLGEEQRILDAERRCASAFELQRAAVHIQSSAQFDRVLLAWTNAESHALLQVCLAGWICFLSHAAQLLERERRAVEARMTHKSTCDLMVFVLEREQC